MTFPGENLVIGRYCGTIIDFGPTLTDKILRNNGQQVQRSIYRELTPDELVNPDDINNHDEFETSIGEKLGPAASSEVLIVNRRFSHRLLIGTRIMRRIKLTCWRYMTLYLMQWKIILGRR